MSAHSAVADPVEKLCPKCGSRKTAIEPRSLLDGVLGLKLRGYRCGDCGRSFRAADRRRFRRPAAQN